MREIICGIYKITNIATNEIYIGQSYNFYLRKYEHLRRMRNHTHFNKYLQKAYNEYGEENFKFEIILICERTELTYYEQKLVDLYNPDYNICKECVDSTLGFRHTEESKALMSKIKTGKKFSDETRKKISDGNKGEKNGMFGHKFSDEEILKMSETRKGRKISEEGRKNISEAKKGDKNPNYQKTPSEETRAKMSIASKKVWEIRKFKMLCDYYSELT
jgi:group I intron endonuclease